MVDARFPPYAPGSRCYYDFLDAGETGLLAAEVRRTLEALAASAPARVAKGQLSAAEAGDEAALWLAVALDLEQGPKNIARHDGILAEFQATAPRWEAKVDGLRKEIEARRNGYEAAIAKGQLTAGQAKAQLERLEAVHDLYWRQGFAFDGARDELRAIGDAILEQETAGANQ